MAKGSLAELRTQLDIAHRVNYISREVFIIVVPDVDLALMQPNIHLKVASNVDFRVLFELIQLILLIFVW